MKSIDNYLKEAQNPDDYTDAYSKKELEDQFKKYGEDLIDWIAGNWSPIIVQQETGYKRFTYTSFEDYYKVSNPFPPDNISFGRETFDILKNKLNGEA